MTRLRTIAAGTMFLLAGMGAAQAQYYRPPYRDYPPYARPPGYRCDARFRAGYGPAGLVCPLERPRPLGVRCHCVPPGPPGYPYGPPIPGRVIP